MSLTPPADADLVNASLLGNRDAFGQIVTRYQALVCSLAYSATGSLGTSEDLAQETFITAWKHLGHLRERHKLKAWLCGIARHRINNALRREGREPLRAAAALEEVPETPATEASPPDQAMRREEETILWRALGRIPENYRAPLILFYREHQSVERVAAALDLTEDAVKQRLARGRKLLTEEVTAFVAGALERSNPGKAFTLAVLAALPVTLATSARAATLGTVAIKGGAVAKSAAAVGMAGAILGPVLGLLGPWMQYRVLRAAAKSESERRSVNHHYLRLCALIFGFVAALVGLVSFGRGLASSQPLLFAGLLILLVVAYVIASARLGAWAHARFERLREEQEPATAADIPRPIREYLSPIKLLGLPLYHIRLNGAPARPGPVKAWFAVGDVAMGGLFAFGGLAIAPISMGGLAIGFIAVGGASVGLLALGGFTFGGWALGGFALGWQAFGGCALAWDAAMGGLAIARDFAVGGLAQAAQANNALATQFIQANAFFHCAQAITRHIIWANLLWLIPLGHWWRLRSLRPARTA